MIIVVEGPDNSGKTTLAHRLAKDLAGVYVKSESKPEQTQTVDLFDTWIRSADSPVLFPYVVCDRHHWISTPIYDLILRRPSRIDMFAATMACSRFHAIYCRPPVSRIRHFNDDISQLTGVTENIQWIVDEYDRVFCGHSRRIFASVIVYDWTVDSYENVLLPVKEL